MCEALAIVDEYKGKGNDACTLLCSLGSFDVYITPLKKKVDQHQKQHRIIDQVKSVQESEMWKELAELLKDEKPLDTAEVCSAMVRVAEAYEVEMKYLDCGNTTLREATQEATADFAKLLEAPLSVYSLH